jgi:hypothetical protein
MGLALREMKGGLTVFPELHAGPSGLDWAVAGDCPISAELVVERNQRIGLGFHQRTVDVNLDTFSAGIGDRVDANRRANGVAGQLGSAWDTRVAFHFVEIVTCLRNGDHVERAGSPSILEGLLQADVVAAQTVDCHAALELAVAGIYIGIPALGALIGAVLSMGGRAGQLEDKAAIGATAFQLGCIRWGVGGPTTANLGLDGEGQAEDDGKCGGGLKNQFLRFHVYGIFRVFGGRKDDRN